MPEKAKELDYFYLRPLDYTPTEPSAPWFYASPVGEHKLCGMVKDIFTEIGVSGKSNHSWRATGASVLFKANVPEKIIQERTGNRSLKALRLYMSAQLVSNTCRFLTYCLTKQSSDL